MLNSVSGVNFKGDVTPNPNIQDLINSPGQYASLTEEAPVDSFEKAGAEKEHKSKAPAIITTIVGLAAAAYVGLGIAVGKGKLKKVEGTDLKFTEKAQNFFHSIGENASNMWKKVRGKETAEADTKTPKNEKTPEGETPKTDGEAPKADGEAPAPEKKD